MNDLAERLTMFIKDLDFYDYIDSMEIDETDDDMVEVGQAFSHVFCDGLDAAFYRIIIFCYLEYSFLHRQ